MEKHDVQLSKILSELRKASFFGVEKSGDNKGKKLALTSTEFACVENCFNKALETGMSLRLGNIEVIDHLTRLVNCLNEKRRDQFSRALANEILLTKNPGRVLHFMEKNIRYFRETTRPQIMSSGVTHLIDHIEKRIEQQNRRAA